MSNAKSVDLIDSLSDALVPVRRQRQSRGVMLALGGWAVGAVVLVGSFGARADLVAGQLPPMALLQLFWAAGLGAVALWFAVSMAMPGVGRDHGGWRWAALIALAVPLAALVSLIASPAHGWIASRPEAGMDCIWQGLASGLLAGAALTLWLRQGAPTSPERAGLVVGLASGATGAATIALHCPVDGLMHFGIWHAASVMIAAAMGRILLPSLLRW